MTKNEQKIYRRVMRRFAAGKLRSRTTGKLIQTEATARRMARREAGDEEKGKDHAEDR